MCIFLEMGKFMNIKYVSYFVEVAKYRSFTKASRQLYVSQSTLSKAVKNLEKDLNCLLIDRMAKKFKLTKEGELLYQQGEELLLLIEEKKTKIYDSLKNCKGRLCVGIPPVITTAYFASVVYQFRKKYPEVEFQIVEAGANVLKRMVDENSIDIGVVILPIENQELYEIEPIICSENVLIVYKEHPLAMKGCVSFQELKKEPFLVLDSSYMLHNKIKECCRQAGFEAKIVGESFQWDFLTEMVSCNQGISILPKPILKRFHLDNIRCISLCEPEMPWNIGFIVRKEHYISKPMKQFIEFTKIYMNQIKEC